MKPYRTWVELSASAFNNNVQNLRNRIGANVALGAVVKSNAYGHGMLPISMLCQQNDNVDWLCTALLSSAITLREAGITKPLLAISIMDVDPALAAYHDIDVVAYNHEMLEQINAAGAAAHKKVGVHMKVDSGMHRLGVLADDVPAFIAAANNYPFIELRGAFTHFADTDNPDKRFNTQQLAAFTNILQALPTPLPYQHAAKTSAVLLCPDSHFSMVRVGRGLYGQHVDATPDDQTLFKQVAHWKSSIAQIKRVTAGDTIGYHCSYKAPRDMTIAVLPIGYWDGYDRRLSNCGVTYIDGQPAPVCGLVSMNMTMIDITDIPNVTLNSHVSLLGPYPENTPYVLAQKMNTIQNVVITNINPIIPRIIVD